MTTAKKSGKCKKCGSKLTAPLSVAREYGSVCWEKYGKYEELKNQTIKAQEKKINRLEAKLNSLEKLLMGIKNDNKNSPPLDSTGRVQPESIKWNEPSGNGSSVEMVKQDISLDDLKSNPIFEQYAEIANKGMFTGT